MNRDIENHLYKSQPFDPGCSQSVIVSHVVKLVVVFGFDHHISFVRSISILDGFGVRYPIVISTKAIFDS